MSVKFYYHLAGQQLGPFAPDYIKQQQRAGIINGETLVCPEGGKEWLPLNRYKELKDVQPVAVKPAKKIAARQAAAAEVAAKAAAEKMRPVPSVAMAMRILAGVVIAGGIAASILAGRAHLGAFAVVSAAMSSIITALFCYAFGEALVWLHTIMQAAEKMAVSKE